MSEGYTGRRAAQRHPRAAHLASTAAVGYTDTGGIPCSRKGFDNLFYNRSPAICPIRTQHPLMVITRIDKALDQNFRHPLPTGSKVAQLRFDSGSSVIDG